jgi:hypothetical protein
MLGDSVAGGTTGAVPVIMQAIPIHVHDSFP